MKMDARMRIRYAPPASPSPSTVRRHHPFAVLLCLLRATLQVGPTLASGRGRGTVGGAFNFEVQKRVNERVSDFMSTPPIAANLIATYRSNGAFPHGMDARDRDPFLLFGYALMEQFAELDMIYISLDDGMFLGHGRGWGTYREPGESGYVAPPGPAPLTAALRGNRSSGDDDEWRRSWGACVDSVTGAPQNCSLSPGSSYIQCVDNCTLDKCPVASALNSSNGGHETSNEVGETATAEGTLVLCKQYRAVEAAPEAEGTKAAERPRTQRQLGYIPRTYYCHDETGRFTSKDCFHEDGTTPVDRSHLAADYAYCQGGGTTIPPPSCSATMGDTVPDEGGRTTGNVTSEEDARLSMSNASNGRVVNTDGGGRRECSNTFVGGYRSRQYDHRWRKWYIDIRALQRVTWTDPYVFFSSMDIGVSFLQPVYSELNESWVPVDENADNVNNSSSNGIGAGKMKIFAGVVGVDYKFSRMNEFLRSAYDGTSTSVAICEYEHPSYMIGSSTGSAAAFKVLTSDESQPCPDDSSDNSFADCKVVRVKMSELNEHPMDRILARGHAALLSKERLKEDPTSATGVEKEGEQLLTVKDHNTGIVYAVQHHVWTQEESDLRWRIVVAMPSARDESGTILLGDQPLFGIICFVATLGFVTCLALFGAVYSNRHETIVRYVDWRLTMAFILGCVLLNLSTFLLLGPNTDALCMSRMWTWILFTATLSPLLVKTWRMKKIVGASQRFRRMEISHAQAALMCLPPIAGQLVILVAFTIADPPREATSLAVDGGTVTEQSRCLHNSDASFYVQLAYQGTLVLSGCVLSFKARNIDELFGEARQLLLTMCNIIFVGMIVIILSMTVETMETVKIVLRSAAVCWGTIFSTCVFTLPRLLSVHDENMKLLLRKNHQSASSNTATTTPIPVQDS